MARWPLWGTFSHPDRPWLVKISEELVNISEQIVKISKELVKIGEELVNISEKIVSRLHGYMLMEPVPGAYGLKTYPGEGLRISDFE